MCGQVDEHAEERRNDDEQQPRRLGDAADAGYGRCPPWRRARSSPRARRRRTGTSSRRRQESDSRRRTACVQRRVRGRSDHHPRWVDSATGVQLCRSDRHNCTAGRRTDSDDEAGAGPGVRGLPVLGSSPTDEEGHAAHRDHDCGSREEDADRDTGVGEVGPVVARPSSAGGALAAREVEGIVPIVPLGRGGRRGRGGVVGRDGRIAAPWWSSPESSRRSGSMKVSVSRVTAPLRASARPWTVTPVVTVIEVSGQDVPDEDRVRSPASRSCRPARRRCTPGRR